MNREEALKTIQKQISFCNWKLAIDAYQLARDKEINGGSERIVEQMKQFMEQKMNCQVTEQSPKFR